MLTLWAAVVAERLGYSHDEALTLGKAVAGLNAYSKGKALGLFRPTPESLRRERAAKAKRAGVVGNSSGRGRMGRRRCAGLEADPASERQVTASAQVQLREVRVAAAA